MKISTPSEIYSIVLGEIDNLVHSLKMDITNEEIRNSQEDAQKQLSGIHGEITCELENLQKNSEWDVFSIAFYGETNAGKSTLIETLRILLREPTKEKERDGYKKIKDSLMSIQKQIEQRENLIEQTNMEYQLKINDSNEKINVINLHNLDIETQVNQLIANIDEIEKQIKTKRKSSIVNFIKALLGILSEQLEHRLLLEKISNYKSEIISRNEDKLKIEFSNECIQKEWVSKVKSINDLKETLLDEENQILDKLIEYCDGKIIGDGHSDFTRKVTTYQFEFNGQKFALLDLPGIEGKEELVLDVINDAVQMAHAVFYVSGNPKPPQTAEGQNEGTLEKIKKHLGQHTEVYTIFNKRFKNPQHIKPGLISDDDRKCLNEHDTIMHASLGNKYEKHFVVSAYPAFLSVANCYQNSFEKEQKKFLDKFESQDCLLQASQMNSFSEWITKDLVNNCKAKIKRSNYNKVSIILTRTGIKLHKIQNGWQDLYKKLVKTKKATDDQLDKAAEILMQQLNTKAYNAVDEFKTILRRSIYFEIDKEINNDTFRSSFECKINEGVDLLSSILKEKFDDAMIEFKDEVSDIVEKHNRYTAELLNSYNNITQFDFEYKPSIDINSGVNWAGTITSIVTGIIGVILCLTNPAGWVVLSLSILGVVISIGKAVIGAFNHKYRASQQKKNVDENIDKIGEKILESVLVNILDASNPLQEGIDDIKAELKNIINYISSMNQILLDTELKFKTLTMAVEKEGAV